MPRPHTAMRKIRDVLRLRFGEGLSMRDVGASLQIPFTTVADHVRRAEAGRARLAAARRSRRRRASRRCCSPLGGDRGERARCRTGRRSTRELHRPGVTLMLLWLEYKEAFPDGYAYSQFCEHYRRWRRHLDVVMRQSHKAGEKLFVDFPGQQDPDLRRSTGELAFEAELFVAVLGASSYLYAEAVASQELGALGSRPRARLRVPRAAARRSWCCDNLRSGVTRAHRYEPDVNATYQEMAAHYGVADHPGPALTTPRQGLRN